MHMTNTRQEEREMRRPRARSGVGWGPKHVAVHCRAAQFRSSAPRSTLALDWRTAAVLAALAAALYAYSVFVALSYWKRRGVPYAQPLPLVGNLGPFILKRKTMSDLFVSLARPFLREQRSYCGFYTCHMPALMVWDPEMAKQIVTKEFSSFHDRGQPYDENDPLSLHLFNLEGQRWRNLRNRLSPTFTSGKLKLMYHLMRDVSDTLVDEVRAELKNSGDNEVEMKDLLTRFSTDVIGTCAFRIDCNSLKNKNNEFLHMSSQLLRPNFWAVIRLFLLTIHPKLANLIPLKFFLSKTNRFFLALMRDTVEYRRKHNIERNDFVQLMMQIQEKDLEQRDTDHHIDFTHAVMTAQAFIFFLAGLENIANTVGFCLTRLAYDADLQRRVAEEVRAVCKEHDGELTYEALQKMDLVERVMKEGLRMWNPVNTLMRKCNEKTVLGGELTVEKGTAIFITPEVMHKNPELYPEPEKFDPDRFNREAEAARHPYAYLPFGEGPRICIAERFAKLEMKLALATLLDSFEFSPCSKTDKTTQLDSKGIFPQPKNGFWLKAEPKQT